MSGLLRPPPQPPRLVAPKAIVLSIEEFSFSIEESSVLKYQNGPANALKRDLASATSVFCRTNHHFQHGRMVDFVLKNDDFEYKLTMSASTVSTETATLGSAEAPRIPHKIHQF